MVKKKVQRTQIPTTVALDPDVREALERLAEKEGRTLSNYIRRVLDQHLQAANIMEAA